MTAESKRRCPRDVRLVCFDVDGVFTDGRFYLSDDGVETKAFCTQDGYGVRQLVRAGINVAVISGRQSVAAERRMAELGVGHVILGCKDKVAAFDDVVTKLGISVRQTVCVGDDMPDLQLLQRAAFAVAVFTGALAFPADC